MAYTKTVWQNDVTPLSADNLNNLETQYDRAVETAKLNASYTLVQGAGGDGSTSIALAADSGTPSFAGPAKFGTAALRGGALSATGRTPQPFDQTAPLTAEAWVNPSAHFGSTYVLLSLGAAAGSNGFWVGINAADQLVFNNGAAPIVLPGSLTLGSWQHVAFTFWSDAGVNRLTGAWLNGVALAIPTNTPTYVGWSNIFCIGGLVGNNSYNFPGAIDEVRISAGARYASGFTPATSAFGFDTSTLVLTHLEAASALVPGQATYPARPSVPNGQVTYVGSAQPTDMQTFDVWRKVAS